tara:strand:+ start:1424 stop:1741 length:318 start_codon:yes stop_codon:yes gene_type:complete
MSFSNYNIINVPINGKMYRLWVADTHEKRSKGLSGISDMPDCCGMIFVYKNDAPRSFTMKNTKIPLKIAFFDKDYNLVHNEKGYPHQEASIVCEKDIRYVIEIMG